MRRPIVQIIGQSGIDLIPGWGSALISVSWTDVDGGDSDELNITYSVSAPFPDSPAEGTRYRLIYGWDLSGLRDGGLYTYQSDTLGGDPETGYMRNAGTTASGAVMPTIVIPYRLNQNFSITSEARGKYKDIGAGYFDPSKGIQELFEGGSIGSASRYLNLHPARTKDEAEYAGKAQGAEQARGTFSGSFEADGSVTAMSGAPVKLDGFGASRDAADLVAASIEHNVTFEENGGWTMMVEVENRQRK
ncbi:hypothetical protein [Shinella sp.]|uniref:hypothetical protein n=1 Tax=Shinella sp. TaxID=1870904 RepID=UPI0029BEA64E|nr:hypothetical protein [Shinella sp.]MDX3978932.1 hypothetical protein [Shinella sp.]